MSALLGVLRRAPAATVLTILGFSGCLLCQAPPAAAPPATPPPPRPAFTPTPEMLAIQAASEKDHQRVMDELGIKQLRPGVDSDPKSPHAANYDEAKANVFGNLPNPLILSNGEHVATADKVARIKVWEVATPGGTSDGRRLWSCSIARSWDARRPTCPGSRGK